MWRPELFLDKVQHWIFLHFCPGEYEHLRHLVDEVISLEVENKRLGDALAGWEVSHNYSQLSPSFTVTSNSSDKTYFVPDDKEPK